MSRATKWHLTQASVAAAVVVLDHSDILIKLLTTAQLTSESTNSLVQPGPNYAGPLNTWYSWIFCWSRLKSLLGGDCTRIDRIPISWAISVSTMFSEQ